MSTRYVRQEMLSELPAPSGTKGPIFWIRKNLFPDPLNGFLTLLAIYILYKIIPPFLDFALFSSTWSGEDRNVCATLAQGGNREDGWFGACWPYVSANLKLFIYGRYPVEELWRVNWVYVMFAIGSLGLLIPSVPFKRENLIFMFGIFPVAAFVLLTGGHVELNGFLIANTIR